MAGQVAGCERGAGDRARRGARGRQAIPHEAGETERRPFPSSFRLHVMRLPWSGGVAGGTYLFALPGSPGACRDAWDEILAAQLDYRHRPCNFVELLPRLDEHLRRK